LLFGERTLGGYRGARRATSDVDSADPADLTIEISRGRANRRPRLPAPKVSQRKRGEIENHGPAPTTFCTSVGRLLGFPRDRRDERAEANRLDDRRQRQG